MSDEWGQWVEHDGKGCPVPMGTWVEVIGSHGFRQEARISIASFNPHTSQWLGRIIWGYDFVARYRVRKPRGVTVLEELLVNLPEEEEA